MDKVRPANRSGTDIHPNNGFVQRAASRFAPNHRRLSLIGEPNSLESTVHVVSLSSGLVNRLRYTNPHTLHNLHRIVLHPSSEIHRGKRNQTTSLRKHRNKQTNTRANNWSTENNKFLIFVLWTRLHKTRQQSGKKLDERESGGGTLLVGRTEWTRPGEIRLGELVCRRWWIGCWWYLDRLTQSTHPLSTSLSPSHEFDSEQSKTNWIWKQREKERERERLQKNTMSKMDKYSGVERVWI